MIRRFVRKLFTHWITQYIEKGWALGRNALQNFDERRKNRLIPGLIGNIARPGLRRSQDLLALIGLSSELSANVANHLSGVSLEQLLYQCY